MKKMASVVLSILMCLTAVPFNKTAYAEESYCPFTGGKGTVDDPYQIATAYDLLHLAELVNDIDETEKYRSAFYIQTADIDLSGKKWLPIGYFRDSNDNWTHCYFIGVYDGNYHTITNLNCEENGNYRGLFGRIGDNDTDNTGKTEIRNLSVLGSISSNGGVIGGIVGEVSGGASVRNCSFEGDIKGTNGVGGIAGYIYNGGYIENCYHSGNISANTNAGGVVGNVAVNVGEYKSHVNAKVTNTYHGTGKISVSEENQNKTGGIIGNLDLYENKYSCTATFENNYYLKDTCNGAINGSTYQGCYSLDAEFLKDVDELLGFPFVHNDTETLNNGCPVFEWQSIPYKFKGSGVADDPYQISSKEELEKMRDLVNSKFFTDKYNDKCYIQTADIDLKNENWTPIGTRMINNKDLSAPLFWGSYNGNFHSIKNLFVNENEGNKYSGLFGSFRGNGTIENLIIYGTVKSNGPCVGGITGEVVNGGGIIRNCAFIGDVSGKNTIGGIAGIIYQSGTIENCYHIGSVSSITEENEVGGIAGALCAGYHDYVTGNAVLKNCYNIGKVEGNKETTGSIVGRMEVRAVSEGKVIVENCYSIKDESPTNGNGKYTSYEVTALSENMLKKAAEKIGDSFVKNPYIDVNNGYPIFTWQSIEGDVNVDGSFNVADVLLIQKWLLKDVNSMSNWRAADLCKDDRIDVFDLCLMKKKIISA